MVYRATTPVPFMTLKTSQLAVRFNGFKYSTFCIFTFFFKYLILGYCKLACSSLQLNRQGHYFFQLIVLLRTIQIWWL